MADMANLSGYLDNATTQYTFKPASKAGDRVYIENDTTKSAVGRARVTMSETKQKNGIMRRLYKLELPVMEQASGGNLAGLVAPPTVAHTVVAQMQVFAHERATAVDVSNAVKLLMTMFGTDTGAVGTAGVYAGYTSQAAEHIIQGFLPD